MVNGSGLDDGELLEIDANASFCNVSRESPAFVLTSDAMPIQI
jgi:hypothetical protein